MSKNENYIINKNIEKLRRNEPTNFLDPKELKSITSKLKKNEYNIFYPYKDSDKVILYKDKLPQIKLLEIISYNQLTHREILGSLFSLNISNDTFGDIIIYNNKYYIFITENIYDLIEKEYHSISNNIIKIKEVDINTLNNYQRQYEDIEIIVSSLRIDTVISRLICTNRNNIKNLINKKEIILNYNPLSNNSYLIKENDIFSIRKYGKYKFIGIIKNTKKDNYIIKLNKYM